MNAQTRPDTIALLSTRRSVKPLFLSGPGPSRDEIGTLLRLAARVPDHGKLAPWRFLVIQGEAQQRLGALALSLKLKDAPGLDAQARELEQNRFSLAPLVIGVVSRAREHAKIPIWEQQLSAGAAAMNLVVAATALGYECSWLTEWPAYDARFRAGIGLADDERIAGFVHIGRSTITPEDRDRPNLDDIVAWL
jgi:nitroreductase